jgi:hypothetical protein
MRHFLAAGLILELLGASRPVQTPAVTLPAAAMTAAEAGALPLASVLATHGVPASVVTTDDPSSVTPVRIGPAPPPNVTIDQVVARFQARHPKETVALVDGMLRFEPSDLACSRALDTIKLKANSIETDSARILVVLSWLASGDPPPVHAGTVGVLGAREGDPLQPPPQLPTVRLVIAEGMTLRAAFDAVIKQSKGGVWIVWQHTRDDGATGCRSVGYYPNGQVGASMKDFVILRAEPALDRRRPRAAPATSRPPAPPVATAPARR